MGESAQATEWFLQLLGVVPTDASILQRMGEMCDAEGDKSQAFQYHYDVSNTLRKIKAASSQRASVKSNGRAEYISM